MGFAVCTHTSIRDCTPVSVTPYQKFLHLTKQNVDAITAPEQCEHITARVTRLVVYWDKLLNLTDLIVTNDSVTQGIAIIHPNIKSNFY